jgi:drug/metabolite transporter (DMT)-like permease
MTAVPPASAPLPLPPLPAARTGAWLVFAAAVVWSFGGVFARLLADVYAAPGVWTVVFWRCLWAAAFLAGFIAVRDGPRTILPGIRAMGWPGLAVALAFATASTAFVVALEHTTVANVLLVQAGVPLLAALLARVFLGERVSGPTAAAIVLVLAGVAIMVSDSLPGAGGGGGSAIGDLLAVTIAVCFATATVITRRFAQVRMTPAVCLGALIAMAFAATRVPSFPGDLAVPAGAMALLAGFGALSFGLGLALFVTGARLVPAATAALLGVAETLLGPFWVWLAFGETPEARTLVGGGLVVLALVGHLALGGRGQRPG